MELISACSCQLCSTTVSQDPSCTLFSSSLCTTLSMIHALEASAVMQHAPEPLPPPGNIIQHTRPQKHHNISCARYERGAVPLNPCAALVHLSLCHFSFMSSMQQLFYYVKYRRISIQHVSKVLSKFSNTLVHYPKCSLRHS